MLELDTLAAAGVGKAVGSGLSRGLSRFSNFASRQVSVIGPRATYREFARQRGANFLDVIDDVPSSQGGWSMRKNVKFLQEVVRRGDDVIFAGKYNPARLHPNSILAQEIRYLQRHGYKWNKDFTRLIKQ